ncbi:MAG: triphosphoribosyl-dephospho-CoA synthase [Candidatus Freyarchaeota archaeon]
MREAVEYLLKNSTEDDAVHLCRAVKTASSNWLGQVNTAPDVSSDSFEEEILSKGYTLESILRVSKQWDIVAFEIVENYPITFTEGLPFFRDMASKYDLNTAIVHLFLHILSRHPDTFIARKVGLKQTVDIQEAVKNRYGKGLRSIP